MNQYLVMVRYSKMFSLLSDNFLCYADDARHAEEQARDAYPEGVAYETYTLTLAPENT